MPIPPDTGLVLGDITMWAHTGHAADASGVKWKLTRLDGWDDGWESGVGTGVQQRTYADGTWVTALYAGSRLIHVDGSITADTWDDVTRAWDRLLAQIPFRTTAPITVSTGDGTVPDRIAQIRQEGKPILKDRHDNRTGFSLSLLAPDPRRYDAMLQTLTLVLPVSTGGLVWPVTYPATWTGVTANSTGTVINTGTWDSPPVITVTGPCPPCRITNLTTGQSLRVMDAVLAGQELVIDVGAGTATIDGQGRSVLGSWWHLVRGSNTIAFSADTYDAGASVDIEFRSAWK